MASETSTLRQSPIKQTARSWYHRLLPGSLKVEFTRVGSPRPGFFVVGGSHEFNLNVPMGLHQDLPNGAIEGLRGGRFDSLQ